jgi:hypothetical protein
MRLEKTFILVIIITLFALPVGLKLNADPAPSVITSQLPLTEAVAEDTPASVQDAPIRPVIRACSKPVKLYRITRATTIYRYPTAESRAVGQVRSTSMYLGNPSWVPAINSRADWIQVPHNGGLGWIRMPRGDKKLTPYRVVVDIASRELHAYRGCKRLFTTRVGVGAPSSPSPRGYTYVVDRVNVPASQPQFGHYAFGLALKQKNLPEGWTGGDQMALHGTNEPSSIGRDVGAGCIRMRAQDLDRLKPLLPLGAPVRLI